MNDAGKCGRTWSFMALPLAIWAIASLSAPASAPASPGHAAAALPAAGMMQLMVQTIAPAAATVWTDSYSEKLTDDDWSRLRSAAVTLRETATIVAEGGTLPADRAKAASPAWTEWAQKYADLAAALERATQVKEQQALAAAGDAMVDVCGGCHTAFPATVP